MIRITDTLAISEDLIVERFIRASGPGGQNVNKVSSAVELRFNVAASDLPGDLKARLARLAGRSLSQDGILIIAAQEHRSQERNRAEAMARLVVLLKRAAIRPKRRIATRPTKASKTRRLDAKTRRGRTKLLRSGKPGHD
jgi:ribosome-associated protein